MKTAIDAPTGTGDAGISIIMPVYNGHDFIIKSLPPLIGMLQRGEVREVMVVDDSSTDATARVAAELGARVIHSGGRLGPGAARNQAAEQAVGDILWFVDADVIIHDDAVNYIKEGFTEPGVVAVFGSYDDRPPAQNFLSQYKNLVHHFYHHRAHREASVFWAGCGAVRKDAFLGSGGFDVEHYPCPSIEDVELGSRLRDAGGRILLIPALQGTHLKVWRFFNLIHTEIFCRAIPWSRLMLSRTGIIADLNVSPGERLRAGYAGVLLLALPVMMTGLLSWWLLLPGVVIAMLLNWRLLSLFYRRKGLLFALRGLLFHQLYYIYSSCAFVYSWLAYRLGGATR